MAFATNSITFAPSPKLTLNSKDRKNKKKFILYIYSKEYRWKEYLYIHLELCTKG